MSNKIKLTGLGTKNFYVGMDKKYKPHSIEYPNKSKIHINLPCRIGVIGASGSCKTNWLLNFICLVDSFDRVTIYAKNLEEPLYLMLLDALKKSGIKHESFNTIEDVIPCPEYDAKKNNLVIVDDFQNASAKQLQPVNDIATMGRKNGITFVYIAQTFHRGIPLVVRANLNYLVIFKINTTGDLQRILNDNSLDMSVDKMRELLRYIRSLGITNFLLIDKDTNEPDLKYRINFDKTRL
jgi:hypothetical protein